MHWNALTTPLGGLAALSWFVYSPQATATPPGSIHRPVATYSIVARDSKTGEIGVGFRLGLAWHHSWHLAINGLPQLPCCFWSYGIVPPVYGTEGGAVLERASFCFYSVSCFPAPA